MCVLEIVLTIWLNVIMTRCRSWWMKKCDENRWWWWMRWLNWWLIANFQQFVLSISSCWWNASIMSFNILYLIHRSILIIIIFCRLKHQFISWDIFTRFVNSKSLCIANFLDHVSIADDKHVSMFEFKVLESIIDCLSQFMILNVILKERFEHSSDVLIDQDVIYWLFSNASSEIAFCSIWFSRWEWCRFLFWFWFDHWACLRACTNSCLKEWSEEWFQERFEELSVFFEMLFWHFDSMNLIDRTWSDLSRWTNAESQSEWMQMRMRMNEIEEV
jgi:hypothetical protein